MSYINNFVLAVPESAKAQYTHIAEVFADVAIENGAQEVTETWETDVPDGELTDYRRAVLAEPGEKIVVAWIVWPDRETAKKAHKSMFEDSRLNELGDMPFDGQRMVMGSFEALLRRRRDG